MLSGGRGSPFRTAWSSCLLAPLASPSCSWCRLLTLSQASWCLWSVDNLVYETNQVTLVEMHTRNSSHPHSVDWWLPLPCNLLWERNPATTTFALYMWILNSKMLCRMWTESWLWFHPELPLNGGDEWPKCFQVYLCKMTYNYFL